ncbi:MAG: hypothetical protein H7Y31_00300 [Chitinophagaceae bacterium]|nr:hypothetical protein [Chitinophagaceae bacterium]
MRMKFVMILLLALIFLQPNTNAQDSLASSFYQPYPDPKTRRPELLTNGFIDVLNYGQMNASARLFKLYLGNPTSFMIPVSIYSGVSANNFTGPQRSNEPLILNILNPLSGIFNLSFDALNYNNPRNVKLTKIGIQYQAGVRLLSFTNLQSLQTISFMNSFANVGMVVKTGAWEKNRVQNLGTSWLSARLIITAVNNYLREYLGNVYSKSHLWGISIGFGVEISRVVGIKGYYYRYVDINIPAFKIPVYQFTFNYSMGY